jgi:hypothetical protein
MSDDETIEKVAARDEDDEDRYDDSSTKKLKKKKKSSSKKGEKGSSSSIAVVVGPSKLMQLVQDAVSKLREVLVLATNPANTSRKATFTRVIILVFLSLMIMSAFFSSTMAVEEQEVAPTAEPEPEEVIVQKLPGKRNNKFTTALEKDFGCRELQCVAQCNGKAKPKCLKSKSCVAERDKICLKRCRKTRCEERCKDEPHLGYVEREQGLEKCKDACTGPTATHNKCVVKCHVKYKPCKSRCYETASKFKCDNPKILAMVNQIPGASSSSSSSSSGGGDGEDDDEGESSHGSGDAEDDEGGDAPPPPPKKKSSGSAVPGLDDDDLL